MELTLHNLSAELQQALIVRATTEKKSLEEALVDAAARDLGVRAPKVDESNPQPASPDEANTNGCLEYEVCDTSKTTYTTNEYGAILVRPATTDASGNPLPKQRDLSFVVGTWVEDPEFDAILADQRRIDPELWK